MYTIEEFDANKSKVLRYVLYKKRSKQEVKNKFAGSIESELLSDIIEDLEEKGYIDDDNYIERAINEFKALQNLSIKEIKYKLMSKGIDSGKISNYFILHSDEMEEYEINSATALIIKKQNIMDENQIMQFLMKKGYKTSSIRKAIEQA